MAFQKLNEDLIKEWNWEKNIGLDPRNINVKAKTTLWWICDKSHQWPARLDNRKRGSGCPYDSGQRLLPSNSLAITNPEIAAEWHSHKNGKLHLLMFPRQLQRYIGGNVKKVMNGQQVFQIVLEEAIVALIAVAKLQHQNLFTNTKS